jgi:hypothetical protein
MKKTTERDALEAIYSDMSLEQLQHRLIRANEEVHRVGQLFNLEILRRQILRELIDKEFERRTKYYEETASQEF